MKTIKFLTLLVLMISNLSLSSQIADAATECPTPCTNGETCVNGQCVNLLEILLPRPGENNPLTDSNELEAIGDLPEVTIEAAFTTIIRTILGWSMIIALIAIIVAAIYYLYGRGKDEDIAKAKQIILYLIVGIGIMAAAYGFITGLAQFNFFDAT